MSPAGAGEERAWDFDAAAVQAAPDVNPNRLDLGAATIRAACMPWQCGSRMHVVALPQPQFEARLAA